MSPALAFSRKASVAVILIGIQLATACAPSSTQHGGDGRVVDNGPMAARRYVLDLGEVVLSPGTHYEYKLSGLPKDRLTVGIEVVEAEGLGIPARPAHPMYVKLLLKAVDGQVIIDEAATLDSWTWSRTAGDARSFYYREGQIRYVPIQDGISRPEAMGVKPDRGWGSSFNPEPGRTYMLILEVYQSAESKRPSIGRLVLRSRGIDLGS